MAGLGVAALAALLLTAACAGTGEDGRESDDAPIRVASYDFTENQILAELYAESMRRAGLPVQVEEGLGAREILEPALEQGHVDFVVDYLGAALEFVQPDADPRNLSARAVHAQLQEPFAERGVTVLPFAAAEDQNGFAVTRDFATRQRVSRLSDLAPLAETLTFGGPPECENRPYCLEGLRSVYGLQFQTFRAISTRAATATALTTGEIDVGLLETTDPRLFAGDLVLLEDDRRLQPRENVVPLARTKVLEVYGQRLRDAIARVSEQLTTEDLIQLNRAVELEGRTPADAARAWFDDRFGT